jgi:hypothetical protein
MVGFSDPAVWSLSSEKHAAGGPHPPAPHLALAAGDRMTPMRGADTFLGALAIMVFAAIGAMLVHSNFTTALDLARAYSCWPARSCCTAYFSGTTSSAAENAGAGCVRAKP